MFLLFGLASFQAMNRDPNKWVRLKGGIYFGPQIVTYDAKWNHFEAFYVEVMTSVVQVFWMKLWNLPRAKGR
jgi:hypothetical protein